VPFAEKTVLVTGAARGIGRAIADAFATAGASVAVCDIDGDAAAEAAAGVEAVATAAGVTGARAAGIQLDVSDSASVSRAVKEVEEAFGSVDVLVNNAGIDVVGPFTASTEADWDRLLSVNLKGQIICARAVLDSMTARGGGKIVNIASDAGKVGSTGEVVYSATKGGVIAFTKALAREVARAGINVNCVCPGPTETALLAQVADWNERVYNSIAKAIPLRRTAQPADVAPAVVFLASDGADYITGQALSVSGGLTMS
jgi:2-hydroxycyclohexanecarboxyl-CoA dehydrogenase